jgi:hypothetical protein
MMMESQNSRPCRSTVGVLRSHGVPPRTAAGGGRPQAALKW